MLNQLPFAVITAQKLLERELHSALPGAPVQAAPAVAPARPQVRRTRRAVASVLHRAADVVAPA